MNFSAKALYIRFSPFKLRSLADVVRGKSVQFALSWLATSSLRRSSPLTKLIKSAIANAKNLNDISPADLFVQELRVDQGPTYKYFKPGAMGRANVQKKRSSHLSVVLGSNHKEN